jgi:hypothetical protein
MINIWLFGDSFTTEEMFPEHLKKTLDDNEMNDLYTIRNYSGGSMDMQTIIDFWTKCLPKIKKEDILIVNLTDYSRNRLALKDDCVYIAPHHPKEWTYQLNCFFNYVNNGMQLKNGMKESIDDMKLPIDDLQQYIKITAYDRISHGVLQNYFELICSLYKVTNTENKFVWSWNDQYLADFIYDKNRITNEVIGYWETLNDVWEKTKGEDGRRNDQHLSVECNKILGEYFYNKFIKND